MQTNLTRRQFVQSTVSLLAGTSLLGCSTTRSASRAATAPPLFEVSLAQWSFHRAIREGNMDHLDFAPTARNGFDIAAVEYVNSLFKDKSTDPAYLAQMKKRADDHGVRSLLIMCDGEGKLGDPDAVVRHQAAQNHVRWLEAARTLGCHSIRVNAASAGEYDEQMKLAADGLHQLCELAVPFDLNVIVENHGGLSSNGRWLVGVMKLVDHPRVGTLPDFGNFRVSKDESYDRYQGVAEMMPYARAVSAKSHDFDEAGNEKEIDYLRMLKIVIDAGYHGHLGIEYEGSQLSEHDGVAATLALLLKVRDELSNTEA
ncbi:MAG: TIM barrel protein [Phycisphaeraceae bacterium]|nr:TIM barrel protein [Phycisphaeraceae bacterium]